MVLPTCDGPDAIASGGAGPACLAVAVGASDVPPFAMTIGVASAAPGATFDDVVKRADAALLTGKDAG